MAFKFANALTSEVDFSPEELEFLRAVDQYKSANNRPFPSLRELLAILESLGWRKTAESGKLPRFKDTRKMVAALAANRKRGRKVTRG